MSDIEVEQINTTKVVDRTPTVSIDPGLKNLGFAYGCIDTEVDSFGKKKLVLRFFENKVGSCPFIDAKLASSAYNVDLATKMFVNGLMGATRKGKMHNGILVIERQYFNPRETAKIGHYLCLIEQALFTFFNADYEMSRGTLCCSADTRSVKNFFFGTGQLARPKKKKQSIELVKSFMRDENRRLAYQHVVDEHVADSMLNLVWSLVDLNKNAQEPYVVDDVSIEILSEKESLPEVVQSEELQTGREQSGDGVAAHLSDNGTETSDQQSVGSDVELDEGEASDTASNQSTDSLNGGA